MEQKVLMFSLEISFQAVDVMLHLHQLIIREQQVVDERRCEKLQSNLVFAETLQDLFYSDS